MTVISDFISYLEVEQRCSSHTTEAYERDLRQFSEWLGVVNEEEFDAESVTTSDIRAWIGSLADNGLVATSLRRKAQSLRAFYKWGMRRGIFSTNPASDIILAKKRRKLPDFIKQEDLEAILSNDDDKLDVHARNPNLGDFETERTRFILEMLYSLGLRQAELLTLKDPDINFTSGEIKITGKRNKQRIMPLPEKLSVAIKNWQRLRDERYGTLESPKPLIAGPHGALSKQQLYRIVRTGLSDTSTGRKSPHTIRHSFATAMINNGADLDAVREMLGHVSLSTTQIYTHLSVRELLHNYRSGHPRAKKGDE